jgi:ATP-binding cassette subfamily C protein CydD
MPTQSAQRDPQARQRQSSDRRWLDKQAQTVERWTVSGLTIASALVWLAFLVTVALALDHLVQMHLSGANQDQSRFFHLISILTVLAIFHFAVRYRGDAYAARLAARVAHRVRTRSLGAVLSPSERMARRDSDATLASRLGEQTDALLPWYREHLPARALALFQPLAILVVVFSRDWLAGTLLLLTAPLIPLFSALVGFGTASLAEDQEQRLTRLGNHYLDRIRALTSLRLLRRVEAETESVTAAAEAYRRTSMRILRIAFLSSAVLEFFSAIAIATLAIYIGLALLGHIGFGPADSLGFQSGLMVLLLAPEFFQPLRRLAAGYHDRAGALAVVPALRELVSGHSPTSSRHNSPHSAATEAPALQAHRLQMGWPGTDQTMLGPVDLHIRSGEWVAITGPSGSGKTLLAGTLLGWIAPVGGRIFLGQKPLDAAVGHYRRQTGWIGQNSRLLAGSLRLNLDPGQRHSPARIRWALAQVGLDDLPDKLELGLHTHLGERGAGLSVGEAQRMALARALLDDVRFMVLDEPTASLDPDNEQLILACLRRLAGHCTVIMTTHSQPAAEAADRRMAIEPFAGNQGRIPDADTLA